MDDSNGGMNFSMPVTPSAGAYPYPVYQSGNNGFGGFGGDAAWLLLLILLCNGNWGGFGGFGGGMMPFMMGASDGGFGLYPWLNNSEHISDGFRDQMLGTNVSAIGDKITSGFGDVALGIAGINQNICQTGNGITSAISNGFSSAEIAENARQMSLLQQLFTMQSAQQQCCCDQKAATADLKYTIATEACNDRAAVSQGIQTILDKLCALELDNYKRENDQLRTQLNMANLAASQTAQTAELRQSGATQLNQLVSELRSCPLPAQPVYGNTPIFQCNGNGGCGCGCGGNF